MLGWVRGRAVDAERLRHLFGRVQFLRTVNPYGFVSIQRFYIYAEQGLSRQRVAVWIYEGQLRNEGSPQQAAGYQNPKPATLKTAPSGHLDDESSYMSVRRLAS